MTIDEYIDAFWPDVEILKADGFDEAFLGIATQVGRNPVAVYDRAKCIEILARDMGWKTPENTSRSTSKMPTSENPRPCFSK